MAENDHKSDILSVINTFNLTDAQHSSNEVRAKLEKFLQSKGFQKNDGNCSANASVYIHLCD